MAPIEKCWHCRQQIAYGRFRLKTTRWIHGQLHHEYLDRALCAECGFQITNFAVVRHAQFVKQILLPNKTTRHMPVEVVYRNFPYTECVLLEIFEETAALARERELCEQREREMVQRQIRESLDRGDAKRRGEQRQLVRTETVIPLGNVSPRRSSVTQSSSPKGAVAPPSVSVPPAVRPRRAR